MNYPTNAIIPDDQLIHYFLNNDAPALETLVYLNKDKIYKSIFSMVQDKYQADEIIQNVFIRIIDLLMAGKFVEEGKFLPWAMHISHELCINHLRMIKYAPVITKSSPQHQIIKYAQTESRLPIINHEQHEEIRVMIEMLPEKEREIIVLSHYANLSFKEIAEVMKCNISSALSQMRYALTNLHNIIKKKQGVFNI